MGTTEVRVTLGDEQHADLKAEKGDATWEDALVAGCEVVGDE